MNDIFTCDGCQKEYPVGQGCSVENDTLCERCTNENAVICSRCGKLIYRDSNSGNEYIPLCESCYDGYYTICERCDRIILLDNAYYDDDDEDEDYPHCRDCHRTEAVINSYSYKPEPIFYGDGTRYFGVELEIDKGGESEANAEAIMDIANCNSLEHLYCKHDGSLNNGFELVTHPMTLEYHETEMPWATVLRTASGMGYMSHKTTTCGLHIHVNRTTFGEKSREQDIVIARILYFFEKHWEELLKFSRRTQHQLDRWAARYGYKEHPMDILENANKDYGGGRYSSVNLQNDDTIEFRIFRGTLKLNTLIAALQLIDRVCDAALSMSDEELKNLSWTTFVSGCTKPELVQYLKERRLYVNEPIESEGEI